MELTGRVALVTGASSGIGEATAQTLAQEGCDVALAARREQPLEALADEIGTQQALVVPTDVTDERDIDAMVEQTVDEFGGIDILVNSAGVVLPDPVVNAGREEFRQQIEVNLLALMNVTHAVVPVMIESGGGDIIAISSANAREPAEGASAYTASKYGTNGFSEALRKEVAGEGVRVTVIMPGAVDSDMTDREQAEREVLAPGDIADTIAFAVSRPDNVLMAECLVAASPPLPYR